MSPKPWSSHVTCKCPARLTYRIQNSKEIEIKIASGRNGIELQRARQATSSLTWASEGGGQETGEQGDSSQHVPSTYYAPGTK